MPLAPKEELRNFLSDQRQLLIEVLEANRPWFHETEVFCDVLSATLYSAQMTKRAFARAVNIHYQYLPRWLDGYSLPILSTRKAVIDRCIEFLKAEPKF